MSRQRSRQYFLNRYQARALATAMSPIALPTDAKKKEESPVIALVRKVIKKWLDDTPSFSASDHWDTFLIVRDVSYDTKLAVIRFCDDYLEINLPVSSVSGCSGVGYLPSVSEYCDFRADNESRQRVLYADPQLHLRVKSIVNSAYEQQHKRSRRPPPGR